MEIGGKIVVESSFFPPKMKELIRKVSKCCILLRAPQKNRFCVRSIDFRALSHLSFPQGPEQERAHVGVPVQRQLHEHDVLRLGAAAVYAGAHGLGRHPRRREGQNLCVLCSKCSIVVSLLLIVILYTQPCLQGVVELVVEHYWRVRGLAGASVVH